MKEWFKIKYEQEPEIVMRHSSEISAAIWILCEYPDYLHHLLDKYYRDTGDYIRGRIDKEAD